MSTGASRLSNSNPVKSLGLNGAKFLLWALVGGIRFCFRLVTVRWNSRLRQTAAGFLLARCLCALQAGIDILQSHTATQTGRNKNGSKHSLTHLRPAKVTRCVPYAPQPLSNSNEPNNAAPRVATRLKLQLRKGSWSFFRRSVAEASNARLQITSV